MEKQEFNSILGVISGIRNDVSEIRGDVFCLSDQRILELLIVYIDERSDENGEIESLLLFRALNSEEPIMMWDRFRQGIVSLYYMGYISVNMDHELSDGTIRLAANG